MTVSDVLDYLASEMSEDEVLRDFPDLTREDLRACLTFAADRERRLVAVATRSCSGVMKNVTVTLPDETARWVRERAAEQNQSVSSWLAELVEQTRCGEDAYEVAMASALARKPRWMEWVDGRKPTREDLHDRAGLR